MSDAWGKPLRDSSFITVGDDEEKGQVREFVGLLLDIEIDDKFAEDDKDKDKAPRRKYKCEVAGGGEKYLGDNARLSVINEDMIGKLIRVVFVGWIKGNRGNKIKDVKVYALAPNEAPAELVAQFPSLA